MCEKRKCEDCGVEIEDDSQCEDCLEREAWHQQHACEIEDCSDED